jgi:hypothetical protein
MGLISFLQKIRRWISNIVNEDIKVCDFSEFTDGGLLLNRKALLVGINKYHKRPDWQLNGCENDVVAMHHVLVDKFEFTNKGVCVLTDEEATRSNIVNGIRAMITNSKPGDELVYYHSGHGSQVRDMDGDELSDRMDECLISYDHDWKNPLTDDKLAVEFKKLPKGVNLTVIVDTCHSGTMTREAKLVVSDTGVMKPRAGRYIEPPASIRLRAYNEELPVRTFAARADNNFNNQRHLLVAACQENQVSEEAAVGQGGSAMRGIFTFTLEHVLTKEFNRHITWMDVFDRVEDLIASAGYGQKPNILGMPSLKSRPVFGRKE